jgi:CRP-like cAMP-binding protein
VTLTAGFIHKGEAVPTITRLRPKQHDRTAEAIQRVLELPLQLSPDVRAQLSSALSSYSPEPWYFIMLNREQGLAIQRKINEGPRPGVTLNVWMAVLGYTEYGTGEIQATRKQLALQAGTTAAEVSRALSRLVEIGALIRTDRGRYALNPAAAWSGSLASREQAAQKLGPRLVEPA